MDLTITTPPVLKSIDAALVKSNKRITHSSEDTLIDFWIAAADQYIANRCNISLMTQTLTLRIPVVLPEVYLPRPPMTSITSFKYTPEGEDEITLTSGDYIIRKANMLPLLKVTDLTEACDGEMEIVYVAGFATAAAVPAPLRQAALLLASHYVTSREATFMDMRLMQVEKKISFGVDKLIADYRIPNIEALNEAA